MRNTLAVMGSTGSIGTQTLEVVEACGGRYEVVALGAGRSVEALAAQAARRAPEGRRTGRCRLGAPAGAPAAPRHPNSSPDPMPSPTRAAVADVAINGVVGFAGLPVTLAVLEAGRRLALANKESLIAAGAGGGPRPRQPRSGDRAGGQRALRRPPVPAVQRHAR